MPSLKRCFIGLTCLVLAGACDKPESTRLEEVPTPHVRSAAVQMVAPRPQSRHLVPFVASRRARLAPRSGGEVVALKVDEEQSVEAGDLLVRFAAADPKGGLMTAKASITRIKESLRDNERELKRARQLAAQGVEATNTVERLETERAVLQAQLNENQGNLVRARDRVGATSIVAPFAGTITAVDTEIGEYLGPGATAVVLAQLDPIALEVPLTQIELRRYDQTGLRFEVRVRDEVLEPKLEWISSEADPVTSTFTARLLVDNGKHKLRAGELAEVAVLAGAQAKVKAVPATAIRWAATQAYVLRIKGETVERVDIGVLDDTEDLVVIEGEVDEGDAVVSAGPIALMPGDEVNVSSAPETLAAR